MYQNYFMMNVEEFKLINLDREMLLKLDVNLLIFQTSFEIIQISLSMWMWMTQMIKQSKQPKCDNNSNNASNFQEDM